MLNKTYTLGCFVQFVTYTKHYFIYPNLYADIWMCLLTQIVTSGQVSVLRLYNLSSLDHNSKISCTAENIVGEKESSLLLDILCTFALWQAALIQCRLLCQSVRQCRELKAAEDNCIFACFSSFGSELLFGFILSFCLYFTLWLLNSVFSLPHLVPPKITKLSDAIPDHHWCIPFSVSGKTCTWCPFNDD